jgi:hypothetical protein
MDGWGGAQRDTTCPADNSIHHQGILKTRRCLDLSLSLSLSVFGSKTFTFRINKHEEICRAFAALD